MVKEQQIEKIVSAAKLKKTDVVLEIGPGTGFVTRELQKHCKHVNAIEKDRIMVELLQNELKEKNIQVIPADALEVEWPSFDKMVSLPPYGISSDLVQKLVIQKFDSAILVFQREFVEKLIAEPGFLDYCALTVIAQYYCDIQQRFVIPAKSFFPVPSSDSALVGFKPKKRFGKADDEKTFTDFIKQLFRHKNKSNWNALQLALPFLKKNLPVEEEKAKHAIEKLRIKDEKVYATEIKDFVKLFNALYALI